MGNLSYPQIKADLDLCQTQLEELCNGEHDKAIMSVPPQATDFDMQISAAFDEVKAYRDTGLTPEQIGTLKQKFNELLVARELVDCSVDTIITENKSLKSEYATLEKALIAEIRDSHTDLSPASHQKLFDHYIQQAQEIPKIQTRSDFIDMSDAPAEYRTEFGKEQEMIK